MAITLTDLSAGFGYEVANPDLSGGSVVFAFPQDVRRVALFMAPRGTGPVNIFLNFDATPRTQIAIEPNFPIQLLFKDHGPAIQQSVSAQSPGGQSGVSIWSVYKVG